MPRTSSQNLTFQLQVAEAEDAHPPGESLMTALVEKLRGGGLACGAPDDWRDCGWCVQVDVSDVKLEIALAGESPTWCGQISVREELGALTRLFGDQSVARDAEVLRVALLVDRIVRSLGANAVLWRIDGPPEEGHGASSPEAPTTKK